MNKTKRGRIIHTDGDASQQPALCQPALRESRRSSGASVASAWAVGLGGLGVGLGGLGVGLGGLGLGVVPAAGVGLGGLGLGLGCQAAGV